MTYQKNWRFEDCRPRASSMSLRDLMEFEEWQDEKAKKIKQHEDDKKKNEKKTHWGKEWSKKEIALNMFLLSPMIGIPVAFGYIFAFKAMINMMNTIIR